MAPLIHIDRLRYHYPLTERAALLCDRLVMDGGLALVAGESGGGKSTLLRLMNGLVPHFHGGTIAGRAHVAGHDVLRTSTRRLAREVGFVFQDPERQAVRAEVTADVAFALENLGVPHPEMLGRIEAALDAVGASHLAGRRIAQLSGGERQRVAIAGALALRPRLLVLDEPLSQLDAGGAAEVVTACLRLRDAGITLMVSEHRLERLLPVADGLLLATAAKIAGPGVPRDLAARLTSPPQVVELGRRLGWSPLPLEPDEIDGRLAALQVPPATATAAGGLAWQLSGGALGPSSRPLLEELELSGAQGEVVVLMGPNGSGKTTLLRGLAGLTPLLRGQVRRTPGRTAYLPQDPSSLLHRTTIRAEVEWTIRRSGGEGSGLPLLSSLGLSGLTERDPRDLSTGERQRAAVAAVLAGRPALALLDEPTRGMDGTARAAMVAVIQGIARQGSAVVLATHDSDLAAEVADRVVRIEGGRAVNAGTPRLALSGETPLATQIGRLLPGQAVTVDQVALR